MPGYWEFPGGKCEPGELPHDATRRECREEIGLDVRVIELRRVVNYRYPHAWVEMSFFDCELAEPGAEPPGSTGFRWLSAGDLGSLKFPGANDAILEELAERLHPSPTGRSGGTR
jgi:8-oxo-dGTP diphosphatase